MSRVAAGQQVGNDPEAIAGEPWPRPEGGPAAVKLNRSVLRGIALLEALADVGEPLGPAKLATLVGLDKATVARLLATLEHAGYVDRDPASGRHRLTNRVLRLSRSLLEHSDLLRIARPHLARLCEDCGESVHLGQFDGDRVVYVDKLEAERSIRLVSTIARSMPIHTTSLGKAMLAAMDPDEARAIVDQLELEPRTPASITDGAVLLEDLERTSARGFAVDDEENEQNVCCVGAAVSDGTGKVVAAVSLAGPTFRLGPEIDAQGDRCRRAAEAISAELAELGLVVPTSPPVAAAAGADGHGPVSGSIEIASQPTTGVATMAVDADGNGARVTSQSAAATPPHARTDRDA